MRRFRVSAVLTVVACAFLTSCASTSMTGAQVSNAISTAAFIPIDPKSSDKVMVTDPQTGVAAEKAWVTLANDAVRALLPNQTAVISTYKLDQSGQASYMVASANVARGQYRVVMDYVNYRDEDILDPATKTFRGTGRIGVGLRITANVTTLSGGVDLSSLFAIGLAAKANQVTGQLMVSSLGIQSNKVTELFPLPSQIDETSITNALQALAAIKTQIAETNTKLTPQILAIKPAAPLNSEKLAATVQQVFQQSVF